MFALGPTKNHGAAQLVFGRCVSKVTFVTRLQPSQLPSQAARQLPDLSDNYPGGNPPPQMLRALGAHCQERKCGRDAPHFESCGI